MMQGGGSGRAARQYERTQRMKLRVERVDGVLERLNLRRRDAQDRARRFVRLARDAEVGAEIEQDGRRLRVTKVAASPLPGDRRACAYLEQA